MKHLKLIQYCVDCNQNIFGDLSAVYEFKLLYSSIANNLLFILYYIYLTKYDFPVKFQFNTLWGQIN